MVIWSEPAKSDLRKIFNYIACDSKYYAGKVIQEFVDRSEALNEFPKMGKILAEVGNPEVREIHVYSYRLIYKQSQTHIEILAIVNDRQGHI